jgi:hypothetical protein
MDHAGRAGQLPVSYPLKACRRYRLSYGPPATWLVKGRLDEEQGFVVCGDRCQRPVPSHERDDRGRQARFSRVYETLRRHGDTGMQRAGGMAYAIQQLTDARTQSEKEGEKDMMGQQGRDETVWRGARGRPGSALRC